RGWTAAARAPPGPAAAERCEGSTGPGGSWMGSTAEAGQERVEIGLLLRRLRALRRGRLGARGLGPRGLGARGLGTRGIGTAASAATGRGVLVVEDQLGLRLRLGLDCGHLGHLV